MDINSNIIEYFSILHDSKRQNEAKDINHGKRSAEFINSIREKYINLSDEDYSILIEACIYHNTTKFHSDSIIQICWDADRLDILRAGIYPSPSFMNTKTAKSESIIKEANERSSNNYIPEIVNDWLKFI
jgi:hypothetical protein